MKIRLMGTRPEIDAAVPVLTDVFDVVEVSDFYPNRGDSRQGRVYLETTGVRSRAVRADATRTDRTDRTDRACSTLDPGRHNEIGGAQ